MARDSKPGLEPAPGDLRIVQEFVNTTMRGTERLTSPKVLSGYLARWKLLSRGTELGEEHLGRALEVREALRSLVLAHNDRTPVDAQAVECLNQIAATARMVVHVDPDDGQIRFEPAYRDSFEGALERLLWIVAEAQREGTWRRLKLCVLPYCRLAFYDRSRSISGKWCMRRCSNRLSAHRTRRWRRQGERPERRHLPKLSPSKK